MESYRFFGRRHALPAIVLDSLDEELLARLRERASTHGRTPEAEAAAILRETLRTPAGAWADVNALHDRLAASGRTFADSAGQLREDRER
jgi:plasmid stability protein